MWSARGPSRRDGRGDVPWVRVHRAQMRGQVVRRFWFMPPYLARRQSVAGQDDRRVLLDELIMTETRTITGLASLLAAWAILLACGCSPGGPAGSPAGSASGGTNGPTRGTLGGGRTRVRGAVCASRDGGWRCSRCRARGGE